MILRSVELTNFVSHDSTEIDFATGVNLIVGNNGAGKSSIVDAIKFALFNERRSGNTQDMIKKGKLEASVTLNFNMGGLDYELYRSIAVRRGAKEAWLKSGGSMIAETSEGVTSQISRILGMSKDIFLNSVFVRQGDIDSLISEEPRKRKDFLSKVINIERLGKQASKISEYIRRIDMESARFKYSDDRFLELSTEISGNQEAQREVSETISRKEEEMREISLSLDAKTRERDDFYRSYQDYVSKTTQMKTMRKDLDGAIQRISDTKALMETLKDTERRRQEIEDDPLYRNGEKISRYLLEGKDLSSAKSRLKIITENMNRYEELDSRLKMLRKDYEEYNRLEEQVKGLEQDIKQAAGTVKQYESAEQLLAFQKKRIEKLQLDAAALERYRSIFPDGMAITHDSITEFQKRLNSEKLEASGKIETLKAGVANQTRMLKEIRESLETLQGRSVCPLCGSILTPDHTSSMLDEYRKRETEALKEISLASDKKTELTNLISEITKKIDRIQSGEFRNALAAFSDMETARKEYAEAEATLGKYSTEYERIKNVEKQLLDVRSAMDAKGRNHREYSITLATRDSMNIEDLRAQRSSLIGEISSIEERLAEIEREIGFVPGIDSVASLENIRREYDSISRKMSQLDSLKVTENEISQRVREMEKVLSDLAREIDLESGSEVSYRKAEESYQKLRSELLERQMEIAGLKGRDEQIRKAISQLLSEREKLEKSRVKYEKFRNAMLKLEEIRKAFDRDGVQKIIRKRFSAYISNKTVSLIASFNLNIDDVTVDEDLDIRVSQNGTMESIDSLSGGERTALAIAVRLAISSYLGNRISTIIMDEPTTFLDEDRRANLRDIIQYSLRDEGIVPQLVLITHHRELYAVADAMYEIKKNNGTSEVARVG
jgi:exonuclease SbcC